MRPLLILFGFICWPQITLASVQITEIAWMGSAASANHEWIELHNTGVAVDVSGWILHDANNLTIELSGTIAAGQYVVLERTSDESAPGAAFLLYTGALANTGATLVLRNSAGDVVDQVNGGTDWENVGGDNATKDTAQRTASGWQTAPATPGSASVQNATPTNDPASPATTGSGGSNATVTRVTTAPTLLTLPDISLQLAISAPSIAHVGQPVTLGVTPSGVGPALADSVQYQWSLGNGESKLGKDVTYTYQHPGEYVIVVAGEFKRQKQYTRTAITILPVTLTLSRALDGISFIVTNTSDTEIDLGGYTLVGATRHVFPKHTILLPKSVVTIPVRVTNNSPALVVLYDQRNLAVATAAPAGARYQFTSAVTQLSSPLPIAGLVTQTSPAKSTPTTATGAATSIASSNFGFASDSPVAPAEAEPAAVITWPESVTQPASTTVELPAQSQQWPLYALLVLLMLGTVGIYLVPQKKDDAPWA